MKRRLSPGARAQAGAARWLLAPALITFCAFSVVPVLMTLALGFTRYDVLTAPRWVGGANYADIMKDPTFLASIWHTFYYTLGTVPPTLVLGLLLAVALNAQLRGMIVFRTLFYTPVVTSVVAASMIWMWLYNPQFGLLNFFLGKLGVGPQQWLSSPEQAMPCLMIMTIWKELGYAMVIYLAGLQGIPASLYEAAEMDGAAWWPSLRNVTLPMLRPVTLFLLVTSVIGSFQVFDAIYVMTKGGPVGATTTVVHQIYENGFRFLRMGRASAMAVVLFLMILIVSLLNLRVFRRDLEEVF